MTLKTVNDRLNIAKTNLGARSCTFYVRDPFWSDELRLVGMTGVQLEEPMFGFCFPLNSERSLNQDRNELFESDTHSAIEQNALIMKALEDIDPERAFLFGDFVRREGVVSSARLIHEVDNRVEAVLFVNYNEKKIFDETSQNEIRMTLLELVEDISSIKKEVLELENQNREQLMRMFSPLPINSRKPSYDDSQPWEQYLKVMLKMLVESIPGISDNKGFGTVHIYDHEKQHLRMIARSENLNQDQIFPPLSLLRGEGVISWVALHKKSLLINDLETSPFNVIHSAVTDGVRSEIVIPIIAGNDLIGVLNLESVEPNVFDSVNVRSLWYVVGHAAIAYKLSEQTKFSNRLKDFNTGLLDLCEEWVDKDKKVGDFSLVKLAQLANEQLDATRTHILGYEKTDDKFELAGQSSLDLPFDLPRRGGMTHAILKNKCPIWLNEINDNDDFALYIWANNEWNTEVEGKDFPPELNPSAMAHGVSALLGIPFMVKGKCIGVAWLEYDENTDTLPSGDFMKLAVGFAANAGLGIVFSRVDLVEKDAVQSIGKTLSENLLTTGDLSHNALDRLEVYVKSEPYSKSSIGGDFFAVRLINENTTAVLFGDGQGHAVTGALNMIPMLTAFETFWSESRSVTHIMEKIINISDKIGVRGTALYSIFTIIGDNVWILGTSAGHDPLVIISEAGDRDPIQFFPKDTLAKGSMIGHPVVSQLGEEHKQLSSGDIVILFTDGLNFSPTEVSEVALHRRGDSLSNIAEKIFQKAKEKNSSKPLGDDATVLIVRVLDAPRL